MSRFALPLAATFLPLPALAHTGHLGEVAGHDHWVAGAAIGIAAGIAIWQMVKGHRGRKDQDPAPTEDDEEAGEQPS